MKCEICQENEASVHFKQVADGDVREMFVCTECAEKNGFNVESPASLTDFLFGVGAHPEPGKAVPSKSCPTCGMKSKDFAKTSRLGCPACYEAFREALDPFLAQIQNGPRHEGKVPAKEQRTAEIMGLRRNLKGAVAQQNFEEAARLRDRILALAPETGVADRECQRGK